MAPNSDRWLNTLLERTRSVTTGKGARVIAYTSAHSDAGTTTMARLFAQRLHQAGMRTLFIDASLATDRQFPSQSWEPGDRSLLESIQRFEDAADHLLILVNDNDTGRFNDVERLKRFFQQELADYSAIVIDCRPVCAGSGGAIEATSIVELADATILVGKANCTLAHQQDTALALLAQTRAKVAGIVINDVVSPRLGEEISRETKRLEHRFPRLMRRISRWALSTAALDVPA
jgi:Mrp family chromosome partitioning ATPase